MKTSLYLLISFLFYPPLWACSSLFFTDKEVEIIHRNFVHKNADHKIDKNVESIYLSSIVYVDEKHWSLWVNHRLIHASDSQKIHNFQIEKVSPFLTEFSWSPPHSSHSIRFILYPQQMAKVNKSGKIKIVKIN